MIGTLTAVATGGLLVSALLNAAHAALFSLQTDQLDALERRGRHGLFAARGLLAFREETRLTILIAERGAGFLAAAAVFLLVRHISPMPTVLNACIAAAIAAAAIVLFGRLIPRVLARCYNEPTAMWSARTLVGLTVLLAPIRWAVVFFSGLLTGGWRDFGSGSAAVAGEGQALSALPVLNGEIEHPERELIASVIEFSTLFAGEIMTPRPEILAFPDDLSQEQMLARMHRCKFSRVLVYRETLDQIAGLLHVKDVLLNPETDYHELLRKPLVVPETKRLPDLLREFRRARVHLAVVCDEFGRTAGVVTLQDLLEEIVGEIFDENRRSPQTIRPLAANVWLALGRTPADNLAETVGLTLPEELGRTLAGFFANRLGRIPEVGDSIVENGYSITVQRTAGRRATILRIERLAAKTGDTESDGGGRPQ
ncbi:MAG: hemolysin family protein [Candidatus Sumerlaeia bacterium]|nr:hemolysin family protein [Candidatus Sumerlaeia bacterium]